MGKKSKGRGETDRQTDRDPDTARDKETDSSAKKEAAVPFMT